jgi:hypothetical protein
MMTTLTRHDSKKSSVQCIPAATRTAPAVGVEDDTQSPNPFLSLPTEIRAQILRHLLWQRVPLGRGLEPGESSLQPSILGVCKTLLAQGLAVLYDNTISCFLRVYHDGRAVITILKPEWHLVVPLSDTRRYSMPRQGAPAVFLGQVKKIQLVIKDRLGHHTHLHHAVQLFARSAVKIPQLSYLSVLVSFSRATRDREETAEVLLAPLQLMRGLKIFECRPRLHEEYSQWLRNSMIGTLPLSD